MKSGSIGFAAKSTSRDIGSPPKSSARPLPGPGIGLYTPPLFALSGLVSRYLWRTRASPAISGFFERETYFGRRCGHRPVSRRRGARTRAVHGPHRREPRPTVTPIYASSTWALSSARQGADFAIATARPEYYTRGGNPPLGEVEDALADLEGGARGLVTGSGMGAIASAILSCVEGGNHVVAAGRPHAATTEISTRPLTRVS